MIFFGHLKIHKSFAYPYSLQQYRKDLMKPRSYYREDEETGLSHSHGLDLEADERVFGRDSSNNKGPQCCNNNLNNILVGVALLLFLTLVGIIFYHYVIISRHQQQIINMGIKVYRHNQTLHQIQSLLKKMENDIMTNEKRQSRQNQHEAQKKRSQVQSFKKEIEKKNEENSQDRKAYLHEMRQIKADIRHITSQGLAVHDKTSTNSSALALISQGAASGSSLNHKDIVTLDFLSMQARQSFYEQKMFRFSSFMSSSQFLRDNKAAQTAFGLLSLNFHSKYMHAGQIDKMKDKQRRQHTRLFAQYPFVDQQLSFCMLVPTMNNAKNYRYEYNLQSIYNLHYSADKLKVVITDDASTDRTADLIQQFIDDNPPAFKITLLRNEERQTALPGIHRAIMNHCHQDDVIIFVDGDDELINPWALKVFNSVYQNKKADVVYSDHIKFVQNENQVVNGWSGSYSQQVRKSNTYRQNGLVIAHLRSFKASLYHRITEDDLKDREGSWFTSNYDDAIFNPILEMSCGRIEYLQNEYFYLYNYGIGSNDWETLGRQMHLNLQYIKKKQKYQCVDTSNK